MLKRYLLLSGIVFFLSLVVQTQTVVCGALETELAPKVSVVRLLGRGWSGATYEAMLCYPDLSERRVAIKAVKAAEARMSLRVSRLSPYNIQTSEVVPLTPGFEDFTHAIVMELAEITLKQALSSNLIDSDQAYKIALELIEGLRTLHANGITHNDLHLENVMLRKDGSVAIIDFGCSKVESDPRVVQNDIRELNKVLIRLPLSEKNRADLTAMLSSKPIRHEIHSSQSEGGDLDELKTSSLLQIHYSEISVPDLDY